MNSREGMRNITNNCVWQQILESSEVFAERSCDPLMEAERQICTLTASSVHQRGERYICSSCVQAQFYTFHLCCPVLLDVGQIHSLSREFQREALAGKGFSWFLIL